MQGEVRDRSEATLRSGMPQTRAPQWVGEATGRSRNVQCAGHAQQEVCKSRTERTIFCLDVACGSRQRVRSRGPAAARGVGVHGRAAAPVDRVQQGREDGPGGAQLVAPHKVLLVACGGGAGC